MESRFGLGQAVAAPTILRSVVATNFLGGVSVGDRSDVVCPALESLCCGDARSLCAACEEFGGRGTGVFLGSWMNGGVD
jgi:hypothetical protein